MRTFMLYAYQSPRSKQHLNLAGPLSIEYAQVRMEVWEKQGLHCKVFELFPATLSETIVEVKKKTIV